MIDGLDNNEEYIRAARAKNEAGSYYVVDIVNFHYLIGTPDKGVQHFEERHEFALFSREEMRKAFEEAGFEVSYDEKGLIGRGMHFGTK